MKIIKFFIRSKLYPILLLLIYYATMFFMGKDVGYKSLNFSILLVGSLVTVLYAIYCALTPKKKNNKRNKGDGEKSTTKTEPKKSIYPIYFTVKQDERYVFAEYEDRYELYLKTENGLKYVRTDTKQ